MVRLRVFHGVLFVLVLHLECTCKDTKKNDDFQIFSSKKHVNFLAFNTFFFSDTRDLHRK